MAQERTSIDPTKLKYVLYARKSTEDEQGQKHSVEDQLSACKKYAADNNLNIVEVIDEKKSAKIANNRPKFTNMLKDFGRNKYDGVLCWHPDRLARNMLEAGQMMDLIDNGIIKDIQSPTYHFDNSASGKMMLNMLFVFAKQYSDSLSERVSRGVISNLVERGRSSGTPKWGYTRNPKTGQYEPDENWEIIQEGWRMRFEDKASCTKIWDYFKSNGVSRVAKVSEKVQNMKSSTTVENIFKDPFYYGVLQQGGEEIHLSEHYDFKPMITQEEYMQAQAIGYATDKKYGRIQGKERIFKPLVGMVYCGMCGKVMKAERSLPGDKSGHILYYKCIDKDCERKPKSIAAQIIFDQIYEVFDSLKVGDSLYEEYSKQLNNMTDDILEETRNDIRSKNAIISNMERELDGLADDLSKASEVLREKINAKADEKSAIISDLREEVEKLKEKLKGSTTVKLTKEEFLALAQTLGTKMRAADVWQKDQIARKVFTKLILDDKKRLIYRCNEPFDSLFELVKPLMVDLNGLEPLTLRM